MTKETIDLICEKCLRVIIVYKEHYPHNTPNMCSDCDGFIILKTNIKFDKKQYAKEYYIKNKEKLQKNRKKYWEIQKEKGYTKKQKESIKKAQKKWQSKNYIKNRDDIIKYNNILSKKHKQILIDYKGGKCEKCGYNKYNGALDFHHRDKLTKKFTIASRLLCNITMLKKEVDKCNLLCANCHRETHEEFKNGK